MNQSEMNLILMQTTEETFLKELKETLPRCLLPLLGQRDGAARLLKKLPKIFKPEIVADNQRAWELVGLYYFYRGQFHDTLAIFTALYDQMLVAQEKNGERINKGIPLVHVGGSS